MDSGTIAGWTCTNCGNWVPAIGAHTCTLGVGHVSSSFSVGTDPAILAELKALRKELQAFHQQWASVHGVAVMPPLGELRVEGE
jgi:hypothetical protein